MARGKGRSGRRYVRDNRGRFASKGAGATARGGRLKTAGGKKRATQTMKVAGSGSKIRKPMSGGSNKPSQQISSKRQSAADRLKIKTATRRKLKTDRASVIPAKSAGPKTMKASRVSSTVAKPRTKGNSPQQVASRVQRKAAANQANINNITRAERTGATQGRQYQRALKTQATLKRAQEFTKTGKLPGRDNSIKAQRERKATKQRLAAKNAERKAARQSAAKASTARKPIAKTTKSPVNKAKDSYKAARADARMRNYDLRGADVNQRRMANTAAAKLKNMERRRSASVPKASADSPKSRQTARAFARMKRASTNERQAYERWDRNEATNKDSRKASVAKQAMRIYTGEVNPKVKSRARLTRTQNPDVLRDRIKRGEKLTAAKAKKAAKSRRR